MTITNLPSNLSGESFQCVFGGFGSGELTTDGGFGSGELTTLSGFGSGELTMVDGDMFSCSVPNIPPFVGEGEHSSIFTECICSKYSIIALCTYTRCMNIH